MLSLKNHPNLPPGMFARATVITSLLITLLLICFGLLQYSSPETPSLWKQVSHFLPSSQNATAPLHDTSNIMLVLKTGASVISTRLPVHLNTTLPPAKHLLVVSSMNQTFGKYPVQDILTSVSAKWKNEHKDFEVYRELQKLDGEKDREEKIKSLSGGKAWDLDKWKFMPMAFEAWKQAPPEVEWFIMVEADTSFSWTNAVWWLSGLDPRVPRYMGAPNYCIGGSCNNQLFAHGGSGIFWSRPAVERMVEKRRKEGEKAYDQRWEEVTSDTCCGDVVLAKAFQEVGVKLSKAGPMVQGETLETFNWNQRDWCEAPITWHHVRPEEIEEIHDFSEDWAREHRKGIPYRYRDVFSELLVSRYSTEKASWDNDSRSKQSHETKEACIKACKEDQKCKQWMYAEERTGEKCMFGEQFKIGKSQDGEVEGVNHWTSGWIKEKVERMVSEFGPC